MMLLLAVQVKDEKCPSCGLPFHNGPHVCIHKVPEPPELEVLEDSEVCAQVDFSSIGLDGIHRPVILQQDDGSVIALTVRDAERIYHFLDETLPFLEGKIWTRQ